MIHVDENHWAATSIINSNKDDSVIYDSQFSNVNSTTKLILSDLSFGYELLMLPNSLVQVLVDLHHRHSYWKKTKHYVFRQSEPRSHLYKMY